MESPPLLLCCDLGRIVAHTNFTGTVEVAHEIPLEALGAPRNIEIMRAVFHHPEAPRPGRTSATVTQDAAKHFAEIAASMHRRTEFRRCRSASALALEPVSESDCIRRARIGAT